MEVSNLCRSCIREFNVSEKVNTEPITMEMFIFCTNIQIQERTFEPLPKYFCYDCTNDIESAYKFIKRAKEADIKLGEILLRRKNTVIVTQTKELDISSPKICNNEGNSKFIKLNKNELINNEDLIIGEETENIQENVSNDKFSKSKIKVRLKGKKFSCPKCNKSFVSKIWFNKHIENECSDQDFVCNVCDKKFSKKSKLTEHKTTHSAQGQYICNTCGKQYQRRKQLTAHMVTHSVDRPYTCDICSKSFKLKRILTGHMKIHEPVKQYLCSFCGWSTAQANNLSVHVRSHTGAKPFACGACPFRAAARSSLRRHALRHAAPAPLPCPHCGKGFRDASALARHRRTHTGERPYACTRCPRAFADSWKRKHHLMRAHGLGLREVPRMRADGRPY